MDVSGAGVGGAVVVAQADKPKARVSGSQKRVAREAIIGAPF
jgi:hypothetical protein